MSEQQVQYSLSEQLAVLIVLANSKGLYDAADWIKDRMAAPKRGEK